MNQKPGLLPGIDLTRLGLAEIEIATNIATVWFITVAGVHPVGKSNYPYLYLKPCDLFKERFNLSKEILCVFHPHPEIDTRVAICIEKLLNKDYLRLDRLSVVLVTNADSVSQDFERTGADSDPRVVVPFKYRELRGGVAGKERLMIEQFERLLFTKDLFAMSSALKTERFFFGRTSEIQKLLGHYQNNENSSVFGLRRIGKTSILWALSRHARQTGAPVVFVDANDPKYHKTNWNKALYRIKEALFGSNQLGRAGHDEVSYTEANASTYFAADLRLAKQRKGKPVLLIFDEAQNLSFDVSTSDAWSNGKESLPFWQAIRSIYQQDPNLFSFVLGGTNPHMLEAPHLPSGADNPLYNYVTPYYLDFFNEGDVKNMVVDLGRYMGATFEDAVLTYLTDDFGGHPFLIRQACSRIWDLQTTRSVPRRVLTTKVFYQSRRQDLLKHTRNYISMILEVLTERYPREYDLLRTLAAGDASRFRIYANSCPDDVAHLLGYGLIAETSGEYHFRIAAAELAVKDDARDLVCPDSVEERWALVSKERNQFEFRFREFVRTTLKAALGKEVAKATVIECFSKPAQIDRAKTLEYDQVFATEFYFSNLRDVALKQWDRFKFLFDDDRAKFKEAMDAGNKLRADAHAKSISIEQFRAVMPHLVWLSNSFDENS